MDEQPLGDRVQREDVQAVAQHHRRDPHVLQQPHQLRAGARRPVRLGPAGGTDLSSRPGEAVQVLALHPVQAQHLGERVEDLVGRMLRPALLQTLVVLDADPRQLRQLLAPQTRHPPPSATAQPGALRGDQRPAGLEELPEIMVIVHAGQYDRC